MQNDTQPHHYPTGYSGDADRPALATSPNMFAFDSETAPASPPQPSIAGCAILDREGVAYFSRARSHIDLITEVHGKTGVYHNYDEVEKGFYTADGMYLSRRRAYAYMVIHGLTIRGTVHSNEVYSDNVWGYGVGEATTRHTLDKRTRVTVSDMMEQKRRLKKAKRESRGR